MKYTFRNYNDNDYNLIFDLKKAGLSRICQAFLGIVGR